MRRSAPRADLWTTAAIQEASLAVLCEALAPVVGLTSMNAEVFACSGNVPCYLLEMSEKSKPKFLLSNGCWILLLWHPAPGK